MRNDIGLFFLVILLIVLFMWAKRRFVKMKEYEKILKKKEAVHYNSEYKRLLGELVLVTEGVYQSKLSDYKDSEIIKQLIQYIKRAEQSNTLLVNRDWDDCFLKLMKIYKANLPDEIFCKLEKSSWNINEAGRFIKSDAPFKGDHFSRFAKDNQIKLCDEGLRETLDSLLPRMM